MAGTARKRYCTYQDREWWKSVGANHCWTFPKGHMEVGETEEQTALRELYEETGLHVKKIFGENVLLEYDIPPCIRKQVVLFLCEVEGTVITQKSEILHHRWVKVDQLKEFLLPDTYRVCAPLLR